MIEYSLENLAMSGVQEIFIVYSEFQDKIKDYIKYCTVNKTLEMGKFNSSDSEVGFLPGVAIIWGCASRNRCK
jgi:NDP-sugar pyrophosphorylase family protein